MLRDNVNKGGYIYGKWQNFPDTWVLCYHGTLYCYLLVGEEKAMLIDTGLRRRGPAGDGRVDHRQTGYGLQYPRPL